ncbi:MAG: GIY-YIG nuclease family protein [Cyclobacteriaceae bacterium]
MYAIVDLETTGYGTGGNRITDIAIFIHDGKGVIDEWQTFVNPERYIPESITRLTRITNEMVANAPKFYEVAKKVFQMTEGKVFVAHNVSFDYGVLRKEFMQLGGEFERECLCTIKLSRRLFPGLPSYSLGNLCNEMQIVNSDAHRAYGDTKATSELFGILVNRSLEIGEVDLKPVKIKKQINLPPQLDRGKYDQLPESYGVYYFHDTNDEVIYVGKANNIKQRIASHFNDKSHKERLIFEQTADITCKTCGSELISLLLESAEIKKIFPVHNRSQKKLIETHGLFGYQNGNDISCLIIGTNKKRNGALVKFHNIHRAKNLLNGLVEEFELCPKYCGLEKTDGSCFAYSIKKCRGVCCGEESVVDYNQRFDEAIFSLTIPKKDFLIVESGREENEVTVVYVEDGIYQGFGYSNSEKLSIEELKTCIDSYPDNSDTQRILRAYLKNNSEAWIIEPEE